MKRFAACVGLILVGCAVWLIAGTERAPAEVAPTTVVASSNEKPNVLTPTLSGSTGLAAGQGEREEGAASPPVLPPASVRFAAESSAPNRETPDFRRHVVPLFGRLGCNGRACHGSFQGRGGFHLSLFGYDFAADHDALLKSTDGRVNVAKPLDSLILKKPTLIIDHEG